MTKLWAKKILDNRTVESYTLITDEKYNASEFFEYLGQIGTAMDIPVPLVLKKHIKHLVLYNRVKFINSDFVEEVDFDSLIIENISD